MLKKSFALFIALFICLCSVAMAENLVQNGTLSQTDSLGLPMNWRQDVWYTGDVSRLTLETEGDNSFLKVQNVTENDARFVQDVPVEPGTLYRISAMVRASGCPEDGIGATLSVGNTFSYSPSVYNTNGQWVEVSMYGRTGPEQEWLPLFLRVGGYSALTTGTAWFDDICVQAVSSVPAGVEVLDLMPITYSANNSEDVTVSSDPPARSTPTYVLAAGVYALCMLAVIRRVGRRPERKAAFYKNILLWVLAAALLLRLALAFAVRGYNTDINCFTAWSERIFSTGLARFYSADYFCDYPPGSMLLLWPAAALRRLLGITAYSSAHVVLIKLLAIGCDIGTAWVVFNIARRRLGARWALVLAAFVALNPAAIIDSAAWGQIDSVFTLLLILCALRLSEKNNICSLLYFAAAALVKPQALLLAPLGLFALVVNVLRGKNIKAELLRVCAGVGAALALLYAVAFPFCIGRANGFIGTLVYPVQWLVQMYGNTMSGYSYITVNALNLYNIFGLNWTGTAAAGGWTLFAWIMFAASYVYTFILYWKSGSSRRIFLCGGILMALIFAFGPMIHERYVFPALMLLAVAYAMEKDRRLLVSLVAITVTLAMNQILVLQGGIDPNTAAEYGHLQASEQWLNSLLSAINVANALYLCYVGCSIVFFGGTKPLTSPQVETGHTGVLSLENKEDHRLNMKRGEHIAVWAVTALYALVAFTNLGSTSAPESGWTSTSAGESIVFDLGATADFRLAYYGGICDTTFTVELSNNGETWTEPCYAQYDQGQIFRWLWYVPRNAQQEIIYSGGWNGDIAQNRTNGVQVTYASAENAEPLQRARYVRITARSAGLVLYETVFQNSLGETLPATVVSHMGAAANMPGDAAALLDEQHTAVDIPSYYNSTYFDEIYHARTAFEHLHGMNTYEWTHPPLGKVLMMLGVWLFGMNPFGWRFMGALMGVLMLPIMYMLVKQISGKARMSFVAMVLLAVDSMHFTLTRIATIDSYAVFFIMLMYLFMVRYAKMSWNRQPFAKTLVPLGLCGITMGCAWATKWTGIYASVGLAVIFFWTLARRWQEYGCMQKTSRRWGWLAAFVGICGMAAGSGLCAVLGMAQGSAPGLFSMLPASLSYISTQTWYILSGLLLGVAAVTAMAFYTLLPAKPHNARTYWLYNGITLAFCVVFFVVIPLIIYYLSYYWQLQYEGGLNLRRVVDLQQQMFNYHAGLGGDTHYFRSDWYEWPVIWWPMWFYSGSQYLSGNMITSISCMGNPAVWWFGLFAVCYITLHACWQRRCSRLHIMLILGFASQYLPWVLVPRSTFIYHYFASVPFIIAASAALLEHWAEHWQQRPALTEKWADGTVIAASVSIAVVCIALLLTGARQYVAFMAGVAILSLLLGRWLSIWLKGRLTTPQAVLLTASLVLFVAFYPLESGLPVSRDYAVFLRWFKWYNY